MENLGLISPNLVTFVVTIVNIGVLFFLLRAILFKPVSKFIEQRSKKIQDTIDQTEMDKNDAKQLLAQYEERMRNAELDAGEIIKTAKEEAVNEAERITADGKKSAEMIITNARRQMELEHEAAFTKFKADAVMLILAASSKLIERDIQKGDSQHFINMLLEELAAERTAYKRNT